MKNAAEDCFKTGGVGCGVSGVDVTVGRDAVLEEGLVR
jgi:hypothetical protein